MKSNEKMIESVATGRHGSSVQLGVRVTVADDYRGVFFSFSAS